jgi:hypothetical protein
MTSIGYHSRSGRKKEEKKDGERYNNTTPVVHRAMGFGQKYFMLM